MDSTAAIRIAYNAFGTRKAKYIALRYHNVRNHVLDRKVILRFRKGRFFDVDMLTKNKAKPMFITNRDSIAGITYHKIEELVARCTDKMLNQEETRK